MTETGGGHREFDRETEREMILDRFLSRTQLSTLAAERDPEWFERKSGNVNFETEPDVRNRLASVLSDTDELEVALNSFELEKPVFPWFLGEHYNVEWLGGGVEITSGGTRDYPEEELAGDITEIHSREGSEILEFLVDGREYVSYVEADEDELLDEWERTSAFRLDALRFVGDMTCVSVAEVGDDKRYRVAKELVPLIESILRELPDEGSFEDGEEPETDSETASTKSPERTKIDDLDTGENSIERSVAKAYPNDSGKGIARMDPDDFAPLCISPGDIVAIEGEDVTAVKVWRADRKDWNNDTIRIDGFTRQNADIDIGERVTIRKAETTDADRVVLAPPEGASVQFGSGAHGMVKRQVLKRPTVEGDVVPVMSSTNHPFMRSPGQAIPLIATETEPEGVILVTEDTELILKEEPVGGESE